MKNFTKLAVVGLAGYYIGFYECKYKAIKAYTKLTNKDDNSKERNCKEDSNKETTEE